MINVLVLSDSALTRIGLSYSIFWEKYGYTIIEKIPKLNTALNSIESLGDALVFVELPYNGMEDYNVLDSLKNLTCDVVVLAKNESHIEQIKKLDFRILDYILVSDFSSNNLIERLERYSDLLQKRTPSETLPIVIDEDILTAARLQYLKELLYGWKKIEQLNFKKLEQFGLVFPYNEFAVVMVKIKNHNSNQSLQELADIFNHKFIHQHVYLCPNEHDELVFICNFYDPKGKHFINYINKTTHKINLILSEQKDIQYNLFTCNNIQTLSTISEGYLECCRILDSNQSNEIDDTEENIYIRLFNNYFETHYSDPISIDNLADILHMNPSYFSTFFKKQTGVTYKNYLVTYRLEKAKQLLRTTTLSISEISEKVGYPNENYFSKLFKSKLGTTPTNYRKAPFSQ